MFAGLKRIFGTISVIVKNGVVKVEGVPSHVIGSDIKRVWGTGRIEQNLFLDVGSSSFSFYEFFSLEVRYALKHLLDDKKTKCSRNTLSKIIKALDESTWLADINTPFASKLDKSALDLFTLTPLDYQDTFFDVYDQATQQRHLNGYLLAGAAGSGKTYMGLALSRMLHADLTIVVCPKNALERVWEDTLLEKFKSPPHYWLCNSDKPLRGDEQYIVVNFEYLQKLIDMLPKLKYNKLCIILDESHNFNEIKSLRTDLFIELCQKTKCKDILFASGTPIKAVTLETIPSLRCLDPLFTEEVEQSFRKIFGVSSQRATDILNNRVQGLLYVVEKKQMNVAPPEFREISVKVPNSERFTLKAIKQDMIKYTEERQKYYASRRKQDEKDFYDCLDIATKQMSKAAKNDLAYYHRCLGTVMRYGGDARFCKEEMVFCNRFESREVLPLLPKEKRDLFKEVKTIVKYVNLKIQGECLGRVVGRARIDAHMAMCEYVDYTSVVESTEKKTVIFTSYTEVVEKLQSLLPELGLDPLLVYAKTNNRLAEIIDTFEKDEKYNPLVATYKSLSTAVPLVMADVMILLDAPFRDYILQQTVSRISRLGATTQTYVYTAVLDTGNEPNISTRSLDILKWSQQSVEQITNIRSPYEISDDLEKADLALEEFGLDTPGNEKQVPKYMSW